MKPNDAIKGARERLGLTLDQVAERSGLGWNEYSDVELHENEARDAVRLRHVKKLCEVLGLDLLDVFGVECAVCPGKVGAADQQPRNVLVRTQRERCGLRQDQLGELIGFETAAIVEVETDPEYLEGWPVKLVVELASHLEVPPQVLLGVKCGRCGR